MTASVEIDGETRCRGVICADREIRIVLRTRKTDTQIVVDTLCYQGFWKAVLTYL